MSQETELDDLDLDKLLDDEDFLEDFDLDEPIDDSGLHPEADSSSVNGFSGDPVSPSSKSAASPDDKTSPEDDKTTAARSLLDIILFPIAVFLVALLLALQFYAARKIFSPKPHISSKLQKIAVADVKTSGLDSKAAEVQKEENVRAAMVTFDFHYPLYSLAGLKIFGVVVQLVFPPRSHVSLDVEQIEKLKKVMHDTLKRVVAGRMLEELGKYDDLFAKSLRESLAATLNQWHMSPTIKLDGLVVH